jgi:DNA-binding response OmpR family regulator
MKRILVIEDEPEMRRNITALLRFHEYEPIEAANGRQGWSWRAGRNRT